MFFSSPIVCPVLTSEPAQSKASYGQIIYRQKLTSRFLEEPAIQSTNKISCSRDSFEVAWSFWDQEEIAVAEQFYALYLNRANVPICWAEIGRGGVGGVVCDPKLVFAHALLCMASSVILFHNHPSGNLTPSTADVSEIRKLKDAGRALEIVVLDHLIISHEHTYYSFADEGRI